LRGQLVRQEPVHERNVPLRAALRPLVAGMLHIPLPGSLRDMMLEARALELIALQLDLYRGVAARSKSCKKDQDLFFAIRDYLSQTFLEDHSLQALAREFGINEFKLKQGFRQYIGTTVFSFLFEARMMWAYQCLKLEEYDVRAVAAATGYKNANHFSAAFKRRFGISPSACRAA
jgi:AraC-like DNA-binding protein